MKNLNSYTTIDRIGSGAFLNFIASFGAISAWNFQHSKSILDFSIWQVLWIIVFTAVGCGNFFEFKNRFINMICSIQSTLGLMAGCLAGEGIMAIRSKVAHVKSFVFYGGEAIYYGIVFIGIALIFIVAAFYLKK